MQERKQQRDLLARAESMESAPSQESSSPAGQNTDRSSSFKMNSQASCVDVFRQLQENQNKSSDDRISFIVRQMHKIRDGLLLLLRDVVSSLTVSPFCSCDAKETTKESCRCY